ncbi:hypothetical protein ACVWWR_003605 [Bradyrhizobium sp. LM3.2]
MKQRVRELTRRSAGRSLAQVCKPLPNNHFKQLGVPKLAS